MTEEGIICMAKEIFAVTTDDRGRETFSADSFGIQRMAALVAVIEREACAKVCDDLALPPDVARSDASIWEVATLDCAEAIRARSNT